MPQATCLLSIDAETVIMPYLRATARIIPLTALLLGARVSQSAYDQLQAKNQHLRAQLAQSRAEQKFVEAGDMLFPEGGINSAQPVKRNWRTTSSRNCEHFRTPRSWFTDTPTIPRSDLHCSNTGCPG